jgi:nucleotide-binding universal stress UspA family protein
VLVATDLSPTSNLAVAHGYALLGDRGGELVLMHVLPKDGSDGDHASVVAQLRALLPSPGTRGDVTIRAEVAPHADAADAICEAAERMGADAICMGSHGRSGIKRTLLGSVAEAVMRQTRRPVLIVRPPQP